MKEERHDDRELICVNVDKVYDWIVKENTFDISPALTVTFPGLPAGTVFTGATLTCEVVPATGASAPPPVQILDRVDRQFSIDGKSVCLQQLTLQKSFAVTLVLTLATGTVYRSTGIPTVSRNELVTLCAPEGTEVEVTYTELDCFVNNVAFPATANAVNEVIFGALSISVTTCQSIQSTYPVTVELLADFCEPRDDFPTVCPAPSHPPHCSQVFPHDGCKGKNVNWK